MGLALPAGGHLTHGHNVSITGKYFKSVQYGVRKDDHRIDMDEVRDLAREHRPKLLWCGTTAYPRTLDFPAFRAIADEVGRPARRRHRAHRGARLRRRAPLARRHRRRRHVDDAQDLPRPARRHDLLQEGARGRDRQGRLPRPAGRPAQPRDGGASPWPRARPRGRSSSTYARAIVDNAQALGAALAERGFGVDHRRDGQPPAARRRDEQGRDRQAARPGARPRGHRPQLQRRPLRPAQAVRPVGRPHRHAGGHVARHGQGRRCSSIADWIDRVTKTAGRRGRPRAASPAR